MRCRCHLKYPTTRLHKTNLNKTQQASLSAKKPLSSTATNLTSGGATISFITQSPSNCSLADELGKSIGSNMIGGGLLFTRNDKEPKRQRSCEIEPKTLASARMIVSTSNKPLLSSGSNISPQQMTTQGQQGQQSGSIVNRANSSGLQSSILFYRIISYVFQFSKIICF